MTRKPRKTSLKCPYCGQQLYEIEVSQLNPRESFFGCQNYDCERSSGMVGTEYMWAEIIENTNKKEAK